MVIYIIFNLCIRFNVYNSVKITLSNTEFGQISAKEVEVAKYLDFLHTVRVAKEDDDEIALSFDKILHISEVDHIYEIVKNRQDVPTPLCMKIKIIYLYSW